MVELAMTAVNLGNKNKGILYKFVYEVIPPRHMRINPAVVRNSQLTLPPDVLESTTSPAVRPAGSSKTPRKTYQLTAKVRKTNKNLNEYPSVVQREPLIIFLKSVK